MNGEKKFSPHVNVLSFHSLSLSPLSIFGRSKGEKVR
jgi:hypothetical protein